MELQPPECSLHPSSPCTEQDWKQCAACARVVCLLHDDLTVVVYSGLKPTGADEVCTSCIEFLFETGEIMMSDPYQYINRR
jgi:hypothetical protein